MTRWRNWYENQMTAVLSWILLYTETKVVIAFGLSSTRDSNTVLTLLKKSYNITNVVSLTIVTDWYCQYQLTYFSQRHHWLWCQLQSLIILFPFCYERKLGIAGAERPVVPVTDKVLVLILIIYHLCLPIPNKTSWLQFLSWWC